MSHFAYLQTQWPDLHLNAIKAEQHVYTDPRTACFYARRTLELTVTWLYDHDSSLNYPYKRDLSALLFEPTFKTLVGVPLHTKLEVIRKLGNLAVHSHKAITDKDAFNAVRELFQLMYWLARTYANSGQSKPDSTISFNANSLPKTSAIPPQTLKQLQQQADTLAKQDAKLAELTQSKAATDDELTQLRAEIAAIKKKNEATPDQHNYNEAQTRDVFIDLLLREAGWLLTHAGKDTEFKVQGMPNNAGEGFVDYVLWDDNGKPLAVIEAKRTKRSPQEGQQQAKLYADCLEQQFKQRPVIYYTNGYQHWLWDDERYPPRMVQGFHKKDELQLFIQRRQLCLPLADALINAEIVGRDYQQQAIRAVTETFTKQQRKALIVMATGAGKTRTVIALCDLLMRSHWVKRVLFLADRVALVNQAVTNFKKHLLSSAPVNLVTEKSTGGRVYVSTYPTMMGLIDEANDDGRRFGAGYFDLIVVDEAHRSIYQKYGAIFSYFDSLLIGLTATPKEDVDRNTYSLFNLENGVPTFVYDIAQAVKDKYLVPPKAMSVPLKFVRDGIKYNELTDEQKKQWDEQDWGDNEPDQVEAEAVNTWLFNIDTVDKVLEQLMTQGLKVANGDRLGKTIIFAKNQAHAEFIESRFNENYPHYKGHFARIITFKTEYAQSLIDDFTHHNKDPHIAISVDMLDTGIDVPEVLNLVFFKLVRSKTKFWQMLGRGTRLCPNIFGEGNDKQFFMIFDYCQNLEFFSQNIDAAEVGGVQPLGKRLFAKRVELIAQMDALIAEGDEDYVPLRQSITNNLQQTIAGMNVDNFIVRPQRAFVEHYLKPSAWQNLGLEQQTELCTHIAGLPSSVEDNDQDAKQFDMLMLSLQLAVLKKDKGFKGLQKRLIDIAQGLVEQQNIPMVNQQLPLILDILSEAWWQGITVTILEDSRHQLRLLVKLIDKKIRKVVITDIEDEMGQSTQVELPQISQSAGFERFREKAKHFLLAHESHISIHRLRRNLPLTTTDITELEKMLLEAKAGTSADIDRAKQEASSLGLFLRSLVGLDRDAVKLAFNVFLVDKTLTNNQITFINMLIDYLTQCGWIEPKLLSQSPFTDINAHGVAGVFDMVRARQIVGILKDIRQSAVA